MWKQEHGILLHSHDNDCTEVRPESESMLLQCIFSPLHKPPSLTLGGQVTQLSSKLRSSVIVTSSLKTSESLYSLLQCLWQDSKWDPWELGPQAKFHTTFAASVLLCNLAWPCVSITRGDQSHLGWRILLQTEPSHFRGEALYSSGGGPVFIFISEADTPASTFL